MKVWSIVLALVLFAGLAMAQGGMESWVDADEYLHIPMTVAPPVIDGEMDLEWYSTPAIKLLLDTSTGPVPEAGPADDYLDLTVEARMMWDADGLYVFCKVIDDQPGEVGGDPWMNDSVELCLDGDNSKEEANDPVGRGQYRWVYGEYPATHTGEVVEWFDTDYGYNFELMIPAASLAVDDFGALVAGAEFGLEIQVNDRDNDDRETLGRWWGDDNSAWTSPAMWGNVQLDAAEVSDILPIYKTAAPFTIDGVEDAAWDEFPLFPTNCYVLDDVAFDFEAFDSYFGDDWNDFRVAWDDDNFYGIVYHRDEVNAVIVTDTYQNDSVEMYWDGDNSKGTAYDGVNDKQWRWVSDGSADNFSTCVAAVATLGAPRTGEDGYLIEFAAAFTELGFAPSEGDLIGFEVQDNDNDDEGADDNRETMGRWWSDSNGSWADPSLFGTAEIFGIKTSSVLPKVKVAKDFALAQNYPNPFNPTTNIRYDLKSTGMVKLAVYDMLGREVASLVNEVQSAGSKVVTFNANEMTSGIYFYKLEAGDQVFTRKMTLLK